MFEDFEPAVGAEKRLLGVFAFGDVTADAVDRPSSLIVHDRGGDFEVQRRAVAAVVNRFELVDGICGEREIDLPSATVHVLRQAPSATSPRAPSD